MNWKIIGAGILGVAALGGAAWYVFGGASSPSQTTVVESSFGEAADRPNTVVQTIPVSSTPNQTSAVFAPNASQKIFKIADGPVAGATFIQTFRPTTTLARFVMSDSGHVADVAIDSAGAIPRAVSNTTIPGVVRALWAQEGSAAVVQYLDGDIIKTLYLGFPPAGSATSTLSKAVRMQFFPDGIADIALSPAGDNALYLLKTSLGADGYVAKADGTGSKRLFSLPLSEVLASWPSQNSMLVQTKSAAGMPGALFSVSASSGAVVPLLYANGLSALGDAGLSHILYQTAGAGRASYVHDVVRDTDIALSFAPIPEKCTASLVATTTLYCAAPLQYVAPNYLDLWHQGSASAPDSILVFNSATGKSTVIAEPGKDGGMQSDIIEIAESSDGRYLMFIRKGDRSLWGVRL